MKPRDKTQQAPASRMIFDKELGPEGPGASAGPYEELDDEWFNGSDSQAPAPQKTAPKAAPVAPTPAPTIPDTYIELDRHDLDEEDLDSVPPRRRRTGSLLRLAAAMGGLGMCVGTIALLYPHVDPYVRPYVRRALAPAPPRAVSPVPAQPVQRPAPAAPVPGAFEEGRRLFLSDMEDGFQQAHDLFLRAFGADETNPAPVAALAEMHAVWADHLLQETQHDPTSATWLQQEAHRHGETARHYAEQALQIAPSSAAANRAMAAALLAGGGPDAPQDAELLAKVDRQLQAALAQSPADSETLYVRALLLLRQNHVEDARAMLQKALDPAAGPLLLRAALLSGQLEARAGNAKGARQRFAQVLAQSPEHRLAEQAMAALNAPPPAPAPVPAPVSPSVPASVPVSGPPPVAKALAAPPVAAALAPQAANAARPVPAPAAPAPRPVAVLEPRDFAGQLELARGLLDRRKYAEAQRVLEQVLPTHADDPDIHIGLGDCAAATEHYLSAIDHYQSALSRKADYPAALFGLAEAYRKHGDNAQALTWYRRYQDKSPFGPRIDQVRAQIAHLSALVPPAAPEGEGSLPPP